MKRLLIVSLFFACMIINSLSQVITLSDENFGENTKEGVWFVKFFTPWCGWCKQMAPEWERFARENKDPNVHVAEIDCTNSQMCTKLGVSGYPTTFIITGGLYYDYEGPRNVEEWRRYLSNYSRGKGRPVEPPVVQPQAEVAEKIADVPPTVESKPINSEGHCVIELLSQGLEEKLRNGTWFVMFYSPTCGHCTLAKPEFERLSLRYKENPAVHIARMEVTKFPHLTTHFGIKGYPAFLLFKEDKIYQFHLDRSVAAFERFVDGGYTHISPTEFKPIPVEESPADKTDAVELTEENFDLETRRGKWFIFFYASWCGWCKKMIPEWNKLATKYKNSKELHVGKIDGPKYKKLVERFDIKGFPSLILMQKGR